MREDLFDENQIPIMEGTGKPQLMRRRSLVDINFRDEMGWSALHMSLIRGHEDIASYLLAKGMWYAYITHIAKSLTHFENRCKRKRVESCWLHALTCCGPERVLFGRIVGTKCGRTCHKSNLQYAATFGS